MLRPLVAEINLIGQNSFGLVSFPQQETDILSMLKSSGFLHSLQSLLIVISCSFTDICSLLHPQ